MTMKKFIPSMTEIVKIVIVTTVLAITGVGAMIVTKAGGIFGRK